MPQDESAARRRTLECSMTIHAAAAARDGCRERSVWRPRRRWHPGLRACTTGGAPTAPPTPHVEQAARSCDIAGDGLLASRHVVAERWKRAQEWIRKRRMKPRRWRSVMTSVDHGHAARFVFHRKATLC